MANPNTDPWTPNEPWNSLPSLPPKIDLESKAVLKQCVQSRAALAGLRQAARSINQGMLINNLPLLEAKGSSEIENIVTTADKLFRLAQAKDLGADLATKEALRYRTALFNGFKHLKNRPLTTNTAVEICQEIKGAELDVRKTPGTTLKLDQTGEVIYTPPEGEQQLRQMLTDWERFMNTQDDLDPLIRMAVGHYQFEAIHPFVDGNGRTGRILNILYLIQADVLDLPVLYLSRYIIQNKAEYYARLLAVTQNQEWHEWVIYMLRAVEDTADWTTNKVNSIKKLGSDTRHYFKLQLPKRYNRDLADLIFFYPYCRIGDLIEKGIAKRDAASSLLRALTEIGIMENIQIGREKLFINTRLHQLLTTESNEVTDFPSQP